MQHILTLLSNLDKLFGVSGEWQHFSCTKHWRKAINVWHVHLFIPSSDESHDFSPNPEFLPCAMIAFQLRKVSTGLCKPVNLFLNTGIMLPISQLSVRFMELISCLQVPQPVQGHAPQRGGVICSRLAWSKLLLCSLNQSSIALMDPHDNSAKRNRPVDLSAH